MIIKKPTPTVPKKTSAKWDNYLEALIRLLPKSNSSKIRQPNRITVV
jgi:hypothetical protein